MQMDQFGVGGDYHDHDGGGEGEVEQETLGAGRQAVVERGDRVLRCERATAKVSKDQPPRRLEKRMAQEASL